MDYEKKYKEVLERARAKYAMKDQPIHQDLVDLFPELKESGSELTWLKRFIKEEIDCLRYDIRDYEDRTKLENLQRSLSWLEKQGDTNKTINKDKFVQGVLRGAAINLINWIDYNAAEGNMCLSNMECKDIEDALVSGDWDKIFAYIKKKLEKQSEQKPQRMVSAEVKEAMYDKPAWSEEDETKIKSIIAFLESPALCAMNSNKSIIDESIKYLKSLKNRYTWKPSGEQMNTLEQWLKDNQYKGDARYCYPIFESLYQDLQKLKG